MLKGQPRDKWLASERVVPISPAPRLTSEGLVLGAGTVLVRAAGPRRLCSTRGQEMRVLALLSAAYGRAIAPRVLGNIERAAKAWSEGDDCLAYIHLAHASLGEPSDLQQAARRLFVVDRFMKAGTSSRIVFDALGLDASYIDAVEKAYNPAEPRVPAGSGAESGEWTDSDETDGDVDASEGTAGEGAQRSSLIGRMPPVAASSFLGELDAAQVVELGAYALRILGPVGAAATVFGLLFIPSPNNVRVDGEVQGTPGLRYSWNRDERLLHLTYDDAAGAQRTFSAYLDGDLLRHDDGRIIGRVLSDGGILIESAVVSSGLMKEDEPRLCPAPGTDKSSNNLGKAYENYVKSFVNPPPNTTPSGIGFQLPNPDSGALVYYDDCRHTTGMMVDAKGASYAKLLTFQSPMQSVVMEWWAESGRQIAASGGRPVRWYFAELDAALSARELFDSDKEGDRARIEVVFLPWSMRSRR